MREDKGRRCVCADRGAGSAAEDKGHGEGGDEVQQLTAAAMRAGRHIEKLSGDGHLYSTIDDDHYAAI